jgi:hypothetical protein
MNDLTNMLAHLRALEKNATPRPWVHEMIPSDAGGQYTTGHVISLHHTYRGNLVSRSDSVTGPDSMTYADGELITEVRNALPELLQALDAPKIDPANHHNALTCPYCNPEKKLIAKPSDKELAHALQIAAEYGFDAFKKVLFG